MPPSTNANQLRLRVFAGPNGSGKSTVIKAVKDFQSGGRTIDFGHYINADDIAVLLHKNRFSFSSFGVKTDKAELLAFASESGLLNPDFDEKTLAASFSIERQKLKVIDSKHNVRLAQLLARFLRQWMLDHRKRFSFETVFSHPSNLDIMKDAVAAGYKVYLYFVATESPEINVFRVAYRVTQKGHDVPEDKIRERYYRSLSLLHEAAAISYQAFFFDNSNNETPFRLVAHFKKKTSGKKEWDKGLGKTSIWFKKYYGKKD
jgi:predicted ABC-type ATPase